jgi:hypothetical protein
MLTPSSIAGESLGVALSSFFSSSYSSPLLESSSSLVGAASPGVVFRVSEAGVGTL